MNHMFIRHGSWPKKIVSNLTICEFKLFLLFLFLFFFACLFVKFHHFESLSEWMTKFPVYFIFHFIFAVVLLACITLRDCFLSPNFIVVVAAVTIVTLPSVKGNIFLSFCHSLAETNVDNYAIRPEQISIAQKIVCVCFNFLQFYWHCFIAASNYHTLSHKRSGKKKHTEIFCVK